MRDFSSSDLEAAVLRHLSARASGSVSVRGVAVRDLQGGASPRIRRLDVRFTLGGAEPERSESFVQKYAPEHAPDTERDVMRLLEPLADQHPLLRLCGFGKDDFGSWILMPYVHGTLRTEFSLPTDVLRTVAHVHCSFQGAGPVLASLPRTDLSFWEASVARVERTALRKQSATKGWRARLRDGAAILRDARQVLDAVNQLPATLLHGDVHPGNIIERASDGRAVLFDWGNTRVGPAGVDLVNCISSSDLPEWGEYWDLVEQLLGKPVSVEQRAAQFSVGRVFVCLLYLPVAILHMPAERCTEMMDEALEHCRVLQQATYE